MSHNFSLRFAPAIAFKDCSSAFLEASTLGMIALARAHIGGSTQEKKGQCVPYN